MKVQDKNASKAPAYATYARVKTHSTTVADAPLYYDIYLGEDMFSDFNVTANHVYSYTTRIVGSAAAHFSLIDTDGRVSGKKPLYVASATVTPAGDIPAEGKTYSLTLTGLLPDEGVQVRAQSGGTALVTGKVTASGQAVSLVVPANWTDALRTVVFEYLWNGTWTQIGDARSQKAAGVSISPEPADPLPGLPTTYTLTFNAAPPSEGIQVRIVSGETTLATATIVSVDGVSLTVPENTTAQRAISFQWKNGNKWINIGKTVNQNVIKWSNLGTMTWADCHQRCPDDRLAGGTLLYNTGQYKDGIKSWSWEEDGYECYTYWRRMAGYTAGKFFDSGQECRCMCLAVEN